MFWEQTLCPAPPHFPSPGHPCHSHASLGLLSQKLVEVWKYYCVEEIASWHFVPTKVQGFRHWVHLDTDNKQQANTTEQPEKPEWCYIPLQSLSMVYFNNTYIYIYICGAVVHIGSHCCCWCSCWASCSFRRLRLVAPLSWDWASGLFQSSPVEEGTDHISAGPVCVHGMAFELATQTSSRLDPSCLRETAVAPPPVRVLPAPLISVAHSCVCRQDGRCFNIDPAPMSLALFAFGPRPLLDLPHTYIIYHAGKRQEGPEAGKTAELPPPGTHSLQGFCKKTEFRIFISVKTSYTAHKYV